jgi:hypothetical protein
MNLKKLLLTSSLVAVTALYGASTYDLEKRIIKLEKKIKKLNKKASEAKKLANKDNIKWDVDFRTSIDKISYKHESGKESKNDGLLTNRLLLGAKYAPSSNVAFYSTLSYNKAYGDTANHSQSNTNPGYANFDWVTNENATDNALKVKEAYWLYMNDTFLGSDVAWTASVGRRPSTDGLGINFREDQKRKSALAHTVNVEFDGASFKWNLDKITPMVGSWFKLCLGRGLSNAKPRFQNDGTDYAKDSGLNPNVDMAGFIFVPYDDGQYSVHTNYAKAMNVIGFDMNNLGQVKDVNGNFTSTMSDAAFYDQGDLTLTTALVKAEGIGEGINDFLDDTVAFISFAQSKSNPADGKAMIGSTESKTGNSTWIGLNMPCPLTEDGRFGVEWNKGSKYWRSVTYGEDTLAGSKIAARGTALELYYTKPLTKTLSTSIRYTKINYDYTGSNSFFGAEGKPMTMAEATQAGQDPVKEASDIRAYIRYRF